MSDPVRGLVLLFSVVLWLPFLRPVLDGDLGVDEGLVRYAGALLLAWAGGAGLTTLVRGYVRAGEAAEAEQQQRRADDAVRSSSRER